MDDVRKFAETLRKEIDKVYPYQRIVVPKHLLDRWNDEFGDGERQTTELALTVSKDFDCESDEKLWELLVELRDSTKNAKRLDFDDLKLRESNPPVTGVTKTTL